MLFVLIAREIPLNFNCLAVLYQCRFQPVGPGVGLENLHSLQAPGEQSSVPGTTLSGERPKMFTA